MTDPVLERADYFRADRVEYLTAQALDEPQPHGVWCVRGGRKLKGFGRIPRFMGTKVECEAVAAALNVVHGVQP